MNMLRALMITFVAGVASYCETTPTPDSGGSWCGPGAIHDDLNCWGSCTSGCSGFSSTTCTIETCGTSTGDGCILGFTAPLCSWHCPTEGKFEAVVNQTGRAVVEAAKTDIAIRETTKAKSAIKELAAIKAAVAISSLNSTNAKSGGCGDDCTFDSDCTAGLCGSCTLFVCV